MDFNEQVFKMIGQCKSRAGAGASRPEPRSWYMDKNGVIVSEPLVKENAGKAASVRGINVNKVRVIGDFIANH